MGKLNNQITQCLSYNWKLTLLLPVRPTYFKDAKQTQYCDASLDSKKKSLTLRFFKYLPATTGSDG